MTFFADADPSAATCSCDDSAASAAAFLGFSALGLIFCLLCVILGLLSIMEGFLKRIRQIEEDIDRLDRRG